MSETQVCEVCGRQVDLRSWILGREWCGSGLDNEASAECYRLGFERARAALSAAEKERDGARRALVRMGPLAQAARLYVDARRIAKTVTVRNLMAGRHVSALGAQEVAVVDLYRAAHAYVAALELASAASEAQPPPASSVPVASFTQEGD